MTDNEPPEGAPPPEEPPAAASGEQETAPPEPPPGATGLGATFSGPPFRFIPITRPSVTQPTQTPAGDPTSAASTGPAPVLQVGPAAGPVYIDIGDQAAQAAITRNGVPIPVVPIDATSLSAVGLIQPLFAQRVVYQSIPPGTRVPQGTSVDMNLAPPTILPMSIVQGVHPGFLGTPPGGQAPYTLTQVYTQFLQNNAELQGVLTRNTTAPDPSSADGQAIVSALSGLNPPVQDTASDVAAAFAGLQAAMTFGS
jgi:hypothetical protein